MIGPDGHIAGRFDLKCANDVDAKDVVLGAMELAPQMTTIVRCNNCGAEYHRTPEKFLVPHTGHASCTICGDTLEYWVDDTHLAIFELVTRSDGSPRNVSQTR